MYKFYTQEEIESIKSEILKNKQNNTIQYGIVVDCETLGISVDCVVFNLAAHIFSFDPSKMDTIPLDGLPIYKNYRFESSEQLSLGRKIDEDTLEWWRSPERKVALDEINKLKYTPFVEGVKDFYEWLTHFKEKLQCRVYYRGQDFDYPIINSLFRCAKIKTKFIRGGAPRDTRSYIDAKLDGTTGFVPGNIPIIETHTALGDVINDIRQLQLCWYITNNIK